MQGFFCIGVDDHKSQYGYHSIKYFNNLDVVQKIQVPEGNTIWIRFTDFDCERGCDTVTITDKDGTRLGFFDGGENSDDDWQEEIVSNSSMVEVLFHTDGSGTAKVSISMLLFSNFFYSTGVVGDEESLPRTISPQS